MAKRTLLARSPLAALLVAVALAGCADSADFTSPRPAPARSLEIAATAATAAPDARAIAMRPATGLQRTEALAAPITVSRVLGPSGGRLEIPAAGFALEVPAGAVAAPTTFTVTALAGRAVAYEFGPHGTRFPVALRATQELDGTTAGRLPKRSQLLLGYVADRATLDAERATAAVAEEITGTVAANGKRVTFPLPHFSGWIIHWRDGRGGGDSTYVP